MGNNNILVLAAHPDDEVLGCGGVIAKHTAAGDCVHVVVVTRGIPERIPSAEVETTRHEAARAHTLLGVTKFDWLDFPAPKLDVTPRYQVADALGRLLQEFQPRVLYVPHPGDLHADHGAVYHAALVAARPIGAYPVRRILAYETLSETEWAPPRADAAFVPTVFSNVSATLELKLEAMACYASQLRAFPHPRSLEALRALAQLRGSAAGVAAAEAFMLVREVVD